MERLSFSSLFTHSVMWLPPCLVDWQSGLIGPNNRKDFSGHKVSLHNLPPQDAVVAASFGWPSGKIAMRQTAFRGHALICILFQMLARWIIQEAQDGNPSPVLGVISGFECNSA